MSDVKNNKNNIIPKEYVVNVKAFAIFFVTLCIIDIVLFVITGATVNRNNAFILIFNFAFASVLQFIYIRFGKVGLNFIRVLVALIIFLTIAEVLIYQTYGTFMSPLSVVGNVSNVTANYSDEFVKVIAKNITFIIRFLIFYAAFIIVTNEYLVRKQELYIYKKYSAKTKTVNKIILLISFIVLIISLLLVVESNEFSYNVQKNGLKAALIKNTYRTNDGMILIDDKNVDLEIDESYLEKYNVLDIDYANLDRTGKDERCKNVNEYISRKMPSNKNEYTGIFKGKNLILICAEAYSHYVIDKDLTPTLYRLTNNGFKFTDFYVPSWGGSTTSGEFAFLNGIIPTNDIMCMKNTIGKDMRFTMPRVLKEQGYITAAYHNGSYKYYDRNLTHVENMGFDYYMANGNGLEKMAGSWADDETMIDTTFETYKDKGPFCIYYMTISGHAFYNDDEAPKVTKYIDRVKKVYGNKYPNQINNYICYQLHLEDALSKLIAKLEENNMLDDTVICMVSDHFPYGLNSDSFTDGVNYLPYLYGEDAFDEFGIDKNMPVLWCGSLENEHKSLVKSIDAPTSSLDLLPTLLNLFGATYDSRLLVGRDVFSDVEPMVIYNNGSFITDKGKYSKYLHKFIAKEGVKVDSKYIDKHIYESKNAFWYSIYVVLEDYYRYVFTNKALRK